MAPMPDIESKILAPADLVRWRRSLGGAANDLAVVTGTFDILQPGNLSVIRRAALAAPRVCVLLEPNGDDITPAAPGRSRHSLAERAEFAAHLRGIAAVSSFHAGTEREFLDGLRPYTWAGCVERDGGKGVASAAAGAATERVNVPELAGCSTEEIHEAIRAGTTPVRLPAELAAAAGAASDEDGTCGERRGRALVSVNGCFDILHIGHARFLAQARAMGDELVVLVNDDASVSRFKGPTRPVFPLAFRRAALLELDSVDCVAAFGDDNPLGLLSRIRPDIHIKGGSFIEERVRDERALVESWGGRLAFCPLVDGYSTTNYIRRVLG